MYGGELARTRRRRRGKASLPLPSPKAAQALSPGRQSPSHSNAAATSEPQLRATTATQSDAPSERGRRGRRGAHTMPGGGAARPAGSRGEAPPARKRPRREAAGRGRRRGPSRAGGHKRGLPARRRLGGFLARSPRLASARRRHKRPEPCSVPSGGASPLRPSGSGRRARRRWKVCWRRGGRGEERLEAAGRPAPLPAPSQARPLRCSPRRGGREGVPGRPGAAAAASPAASATFPSADLLPSLPPFPRKRHIDPRRPRSLARSPPPPAVLPAAAVPRRLPRLLSPPPPARLAWGPPGLPASPAAHLGDGLPVPGGGLLDEAENFHVAVPAGHDHPRAAEAHRHFHPPPGRRRSPTRPLPAAALGSAANAAAAARPAAPSGARPEGGRLG